LLDVFISYSRRDAEFVERLGAAIQARGKTVWVDTGGIADAEVFPQAIRNAIEQSDAFVFVISPDSADSNYCEQEVEHAREMRKRIVPVLRRSVPDGRLHEEIRDRNWIPFSDAADFEPSVDRLLTALDTDLPHVKEHTRWLVKALEWDVEGRDRSFLLRGSELRSAESWLAAADGRGEPAPTQLQREYLLSSRNAAARRQRLFAAASLAVALLSIGLLAFALISRGQAISEKVTANSQSLASQAESELTVDPEISVLLGMLAVRAKATPEAMFALREALDDSPLQLSVSTGPIATCAASPSGTLAAFAPGGREILEARCDGALVLIDAATGAVERTVRLRPVAAALGYAPNGSVLAIGTSTGLDLLDPSTLAVRAVLPGYGAADDLAFSPDGSAVAVETSKGVVIWNIATRRRRILIAGSVYAGATGTVLFSPDGRQLITQIGFAPITVYGLSSGRVVHRIPVAMGGGVVLAVSPAAHELAFSNLTYTGNSSVTVVNTTHFTHPTTVATVPGSELSSLAFSPDGTRIAIGAQDGTAGVWSVQTVTKLLALVGHTATVTGMQFSPDGGRVLTVSDDGTLRLWRATGNEQLAIATGADQGSVSSVAPLAHGVIAAVQLADSQVVKSWSLPTGRAAGQLVVAHGNEGVTSTPTVALSANGRMAVIYNFYQAAPVVVWSVAARRVVHRFPVATVATAALSRDGSRLALSLQPTGNRIVSLGGAPALTLAGADPPCVDSNGGYADLAFSPDGRYIAGATFCGQVTVWSASSGRRLGSFAEGGQASSIALSADDQHLAVGSWDSTATVWNFRTGGAVQLAGHTRGVNGVAYSPNGQYVLTTSIDDTARLWDPSTGRVLRVFTEPDIVDLPTLSPDGSRVFLVDASGAIRAWDTCPDCTDPQGLLASARQSQRGIHQFTTLEREASRGD